MEQRVFTQPGAGRGVLPEPQHSLGKQHSCLHRLVRTRLPGGSHHLPKVIQPGSGGTRFGPQVCVLRLPRWSHTPWLAATIFSPFPGSPPRQLGSQLLLRWPLEDRATLSTVLPDPRREPQVGAITSGWREAAPVFPRPERSGINLPDLAPETLYESAAPRPLQPIVVNRWADPSRGLSRAQLRLLGGREGEEVQNQLHPTCQGPGACEMQGQLSAHQQGMRPVLRPTPTLGRSAEPGRAVPELLGQSGRPG